MINIYYILLIINIKILINVKKYQEIYLLVATLIKYFQL